MKRYYCPYCSSRYQYHRTRKDGVLICGQCGDPLIKKNRVNSKQILGIILSLAFLAPLLIMTISLFENNINKEPPGNFVSLLFSSPITNS